MALLEDIGKTLGQVAAGVTDAAQTVAGAAQDTMEQARQQREQDRVNALSSESKCPSCGHPLNGVYAVCPMCGHELRSSNDDDSIAQFVKQLNKIEHGRNNVMDSLSKTFSGRTSNPTDEKIAAHIRNYVVPNTKDDVFEFMLLAAGNLDASKVALLQKRKGFFGASKAAQQERDGVSELVITAWLNKFEQTYQRAKISFGTDPDFRRIQELYDGKMAEIEAATTKRRW
ncbi:MAG: hypothetical protein IJ087_18750 [Eggerthellaceae bacterium]|nr:hypothetical protein [Eggerthellaceae bacterium]